MAKELRDDLSGGSWRLPKAEEVITACSEKLERLHVGMERTYRADVNECKRKLC